MFFMSFFSAYQVIHTCFDLNEPLKLPLNLFCENEYFKQINDGKDDMKLSEKAREINNFKAKIL